MTYYQIAMKLEKRSMEYSELAKDPESLSDYQEKALLLAKAVAMLEAAQIAMGGSDV